LNTAGFRKIDFHVHTPISSCYSEKAVNPRDIVAAALAAGLDAIAVTDHNTAAGIDLVRQKAAGEGLTIIPGMELTTRSGHFLVLFDIMTPTDRMEQLLDILQVPGSARGDGAEIIPLETPEVFKLVNNAGGLLIAAHIERWPSGFLESKESRAAKMSIHACPYISALEITVAQNRAQWENGLMRGYPKKCACVQGSDAHTPREIGRRPVYLRLSEVSLPAIKCVFLDWQGNIAFTPEE